MEKRKLGSTGIELSVIGLGTWAIGGGGWKYGWGPQDDKQSIAVIRKAVELGINWVDTAPLYGLGHAEEMLGRALKGLDTKPFIATKFGITWDKKRQMSHNLKKKSIKLELEASLKKLKVEAVDLYQMHWPVPDDGIEEGWRTALDLVEEGKARFIGVCNFTVVQLERIRYIQKPASVQSPYSIMNRGIEKDLIPYCVKENIGLLAYGVLEKGLLTGEFTKRKVEDLPMDDHRKRDPAFQEPALSRNLGIAGDLKAEGLRTGMKPAEIAIAEIIKSKAVSSAIVGARSVEQVEENAGAA